MSRKNSVLSLEVQEDNTVVVTVGGEKSFAYTLHNTDALYHRFAMLGLATKVRNSASGAKSVEEAEAAVEALLTSFGEGKWNTTRNGEGSADTPVYGLLTQAIVSISGGQKTLEEVQEFVSTLDKKTQAALRAEPEIAAAIAALRKPVAKKSTIDVSALKASLGL